MVKQYPMQLMQVITLLPLEGIVMEQLRYTSYPHLHMGYPIMTCQINQSHI
jgi:hypothetical protein